MHQANLLRISALGCLLALFMGCTGQHAAPVENPSVAAPSPLSGQPGSQAGYTVKKGDTLSKIGRRFGVGVNQLARWNGLSPPYTLYPGQRLRLSPANTDDAVAAPPVNNGAEEPMRRVHPGVFGARQVDAAGAARCAPSRVVWQWPARGRVHSTISANGRRGLNIFGSPGQPVHAAAKGRVIYSGPGLNGYFGNLIIVRHDASYLSVYAYNRKRLVNEGDQVVKGQVIAEMGVDNRHRAVLHFEISCRDKTLNPLLYLP